MRYSEMRVTQNGDKRGIEPDDQETDNAVPEEFNQTVHQLAVALRYREQTVAGKQRSQCNFNQ